MLAGKRILVTGVVTRDSIAYHVAERAQRAGRRGDPHRLRPLTAHDRARRGAPAAHRRTCSSST